MPSDSRRVKEPSLKEEVHMAGSTKKRGFAAMSKEERTRIARMGGKASHGSRKRS